MTGTVYFALGFAVLIVFLMLSRILKRRRQQSPGVFEGERSGGLDPRAREQLEELIVQMQEVAREQIAKADIKIRMLNQLLADCDQKKKEIEELLGRSPEPRAAAPATPPQRPTNPLHEKVWGLQDRGMSSAEICRETGLEIGEVEMILGLRKLQGS